ncbi:hypothetical protein SAMD00019534_058970 [Acytostelium subglobosum LB1]|uniref:hypothetical protein n=1 Tax=Acytostelium subglobosum LB1 TaxID=1410327 RepID=UPI000645172E|nr:hypothetical protein SAMD00019534_058970 [Acytostelium subglobosum LB1]GAM22722.1 hypothetical protein SAMD00019534_058970 [Acytostelium subglobosum LB1]|eukprot:XP_012753949.1 hypothetical protein SAMD00019534_058970 [Acytostelium subglobosum LB1]
MTEQNQQHRLRFPRGFHGYPYNYHKLEGYGLPKGYVTLLGIGVTFGAVVVLMSGFRSTKKPHVSQTDQWNNATLQYAKDVKADPIYHLPHEK